MAICDGNVKNTLQHMGFSDAEDVEYDYFGGLTGPKTPIADLNEVVLSYVQTIEKTLMRTHYILAEKEFYFSQESEIVAKIHLQVDKTQKRRLTIQTILVRSSKWRTGLTTTIIMELKKVAKDTNRTLEVQSVMSAVLRALLKKLHFQRELPLGRDVSETFPRDWVE
jgi:hypothetical protein